jgi:thiamine biosynthesis lipoprotein
MIRRSGSRRLAALAVSAALCCGLLAAGAGCTNPSSDPTRAEWSERKEWRERKESSKSRQLLGVDVRITVRDPDRAHARAAIDEAMAAAAEAAGLLLAEYPGSEIDILQRAPSRLWIEVATTTGETLLEALRIAEDTEGAFDPTFPPLLTLWGLRGGRSPEVPRAFEIDMALRRVDWTNIELEFDRAHQVRRLGRRTELDLGGLARGTLLDVAVERLRALGVPAGRASTLRQHAVYGGSRNRPWRIEVLARSLRPDGRDEPAGVISMVEGGLAVASRGAGVLAADGTLIHDRFDPRTGRPADSTRWTAIRATRASAAAGYADAVFAMGDEGPDFVAARDALEAVIAFDAREPFVSSGMTFHTSRPYQPQRSPPGAAAGHAIGAAQCSGRARPSSGCGASTPSRFANVGAMSTVAAGPVTCPAATPGP